MSDASSLLSNLTISLRQRSANPATLAITVNNANSVPVTFLAWDSPLDPLVLRLGALSITPEGSPEELDIPRVKVARATPPGDDALVELAAGATSEENVVELAEAVAGWRRQRQRQRQRGEGGRGGGSWRASLRCKGRWRAVWAGTRAGLGAERRALMGAGEDAFSGAFESEAVEITVE